MESASCNVCDHNDFDVVRFEQFVNFFHEQREYPVLTCVCRNCGHVFMNPRMTEMELVSFYKNQFRESFTVPRGESIGLFRADMQVISDLLGSGDKRRALEIGCYTGYMLNHLASQDWIPEGIEPNPETANCARKLFGFQVFETMIENFSTNKKYDLIVMGSVLEHVNNPLKAIRSVYDLLKSDGYFFIRVPDVLELSLDTIADVFSIEHPHMFSPTTLKRLLYRAGFVEEASIKHERFRRHIISLSKKENTPLSVPKTNMYKKTISLIREYNDYNMKIRQQAKEAIDKILSVNERVTIFGAGTHTDFLYRYTNIDKYNIRAIVDSNPMKQGRPFKHHIIKAPDYISNDNTDIIVISSRAFQEEIYEQIKSHIEKGIQIIKLYDISKSTYKFG